MKGIFNIYKCFLVSIHVHSKQVQRKTKQSRHKIFFFFLFTEPLIYDEMGDMSALISERHA